MLPEIKQQTKLEVPALGAMLAPWERPSESTSTDVMIETRAQGPGSRCCHQWLRGCGWDGRALPSLGPGQGPRARSASLVFSADWLGSGQDRPQPLACEWWQDCRGQRIPGANWPPLSAAPSAEKGATTAQPFLEPGSSLLNACKRCWVLAMLPCPPGSGTLRILCRGSPKLGELLDQRSP